jgi:hypothetical protein
VRESTGKQSLTISAKPGGSWGWISEIDCLAYAHESPRNEDQQTPASPNEKKISHGRMSRQTRRSCFAMGPACSRKPSEFAPSFDWNHNCSEALLRYFGFRTGNLLHGRAMMRVKGNSNENRAGIIISDIATNSCELAGQLEFSRIYPFQWLLSITL